MSHPLQSIPSGKRRQIFLAALAATLLVMGALDLMDRGLRTEPAPMGIVSFELAGTVPAAEEIVASWNESARVRAGFELGLDFLFLPLYSTTVGLACIWAAGVLGKRAKAWGSFGVILAWGQWVAALLDGVENAALLAMLLRAPASPWPELAAWCATVKFGLVLLGLAYGAAGVMGWGTRGLTGRRAAGTSSR